MICSVRDGLQEETVTLDFLPSTLFLRGLAELAAIYKTPRCYLEGE